MLDNKNNISLRSAALIAGIAIFSMVIAAPFAEIFAYPKLIVPNNIPETIKNIIANASLFRACIFGYLITFLCDLLASWALYILLKPVNESLSLLTAWFRLAYTFIALAALVNLIIVLRLLIPSDSSTIIETDQLYGQVGLLLNNFKGGWYFGILFFGIHLNLLGYLVYKSGYIPKILGVLLMISGLGYSANGLKPFLFPHINLDFAKFTFYGELIFMLWLLIRGSRIQEKDSQ